MNSKQTLSIIVPLHNEAESLSLLWHAINAAMLNWSGEWEMIGIDDGSRDDTWSQLSALAKENECLAGIKLTRNFGKEAAILAGLEAANGDWVVVMDGDGQHPPTLLPEMLALAEDDSIGIVAARKRARDADHWSNRFFAHAFNRLMFAATGLNMENASDYRLLKRPVVNTLLSMPERIRFFRAMTVWTGFRQVDIDFDVPARLAGKTTWNTRGLLTLAINGITGFSAKPLVLVFRFGLIGIILSLALAIQALWSWATHSAISGWTSLTIVSVFFGSANLLAIGVLGSYLAQLFDEIKARPPYLIASRVGKQSQGQTIQTYLQTTNKQALPRIKKHL